MKKKIYNSRTIDLSRDSVRLGTQGQTYCFLIYGSRKIMQNLMYLIKRNSNRCAFYFENAKGVEIGSESESG